MIFECVSAYLNHSNLWTSTTTDYKSNRRSNYLQRQLQSHSQHQLQQVFYSLNSILKNKKWFLNMYLCTLVTIISEPAKQPTTDPTVDPTTCKANCRTISSTNCNRYFIPWIQYWKTKMIYECVSAHLNHSNRWTTTTDYRSNRRPTLDPTQLQIHGQHQLQKVFYS